MWLWIGHPIFGLEEEYKRKVARRKEKRELKGRGRGGKEPKKQRLGSDQRDRRNSRRSARQGKSKSARPHST
jgi:hypothetical protein